MRWGRVNKYLKLGKGVLKYGKLGILYFKLTSKPTTLQTQEMVLGIDPGASYDGFSVVSKTQHHENINTEHTRDIKKRMTKLVSAGQISKEIELACLNMNGPTTY